MKSLQPLLLMLMLALLPASNAFSPFSWIAQEEGKPFQNRNNNNNVQRKRRRSALGVSTYPASAADDGVSNSKQTQRHSKKDANDDTSNSSSSSAKQKEFLATTKTTATTTSSSEIKKSRISLTGALCYVYLATVFTMTLIPVVLMPVVATQSTLGVRNASAAASAMVAAIAAVSALGGAVGRFVNGFVIQILGGQPSSSSYLVAMAGLVALFGSLDPLNTPPSVYSVVLAGMEFCYSIQWAAALYILSNHYLGGSSDSHHKFTTSVTSISLGSTVGILGAKAVGPTLLRSLSVRAVSYLGALVALSGALVMNSVVREHPATATEAESKKEPFDVKAMIGSPLRAVGGSKLFWLASVGHGITYLARQADRILGSFFQQVSGLPTSLCTGLTASVTLGFVHGLVTATRRLSSIDSPKAKNKFFAKRYAMAVLSCLGLALTSVPSVMDFLGLSAALKAALVVLVSGGLASSISYQFYQFPPLIGNLYGKNKAVATSWFNGMGFFIAAPVWAMTSKIVKAGSSTKLAGVTLPGGWALAWSLIGVLFGIAGIVQTKMVLPQVLDEKKK